MPGSKGKGKDSQSLAVALGAEDLLAQKLNWNVKGQVEKWSREAILKLGINPAEAKGNVLRSLGLEPEEVVAFEGNLLLNEGIGQIWDLVSGASSLAYDNANARIGVGNGTAAATAAQTGLSGTQNSYQGMNTGYPTRSGQTLSFQADFASGEASFAWEEWTVDNGAATTRLKNMNRKVTSLGTKSGGTWTLTVDITLS